MAHRNCPSATVRPRIAPLYGEQSGDMGDGLGGSIPQWEIRFESDALHKMPYQPSSRLSGLVSDCTGISVKGLGVSANLFFGRRATAWIRLCCLYGVSIVPVEVFHIPLQVKCKS